MMFKLNLSLFDGEGGAGTAGTGTGVDGAVPGAQDLSQVKYGRQEDTQPAIDPKLNTVDRNAEFEKLIKGEYKDLYDQRMQDTIQKRLKSSKDTVDRYNRMVPVMDMLAKRYGVDPSDIDALTNAINDDDSYYEEEALERGLTIDQLKEIRKMERENESLKRQMHEAEVQENADRIYAGWMEDANNIKGVYPSFDLETELQNDQFVKLLQSNIDMRTAYEVCHKDEIIQGAMAFTANQVQQKLSNKIRSGGRPTENGVRNGSAAVVKTDVSTFTRADREEIIRRVQNGERIVL